MFAAVENFIRVLSQRITSLIIHVSRSKPSASRSEISSRKRTRTLPCVSLAVNFMPVLLMVESQGTESGLAGKAEACAGCANQEICASNAPKGPDPALPFIRERMSSVKRKILVLSGKGGVGKSTFTAQLGWAFAADEDIQVRINPYFTLEPLNAEKWLDWDYGCGYLRSFHSNNPRHRLGTSSLLILGMVTGVCPRHPRCHVSWLHAPFRSGCRHVAWTQKERAHITVLQRRRLGRSRLSPH